MPKNVIKKICLLGDGKVGKTSLIHKFVYDEFDDKYLMTIGNKVTKREMFVPTDSGGVNLSLMINDIVGQVEFERVHGQYYRGSKAGIFVCDLTRKETLEGMDWWVQSFRKVARGVPIIMLANKKDLSEQHEIAISDLIDYSGRFHCPYFTTSARTGENVEDAFRTIGRLVCTSPG